MIEYFASEGRKMIGTGIVSALAGFGQEARANLDDLWTMIVAGAETGLYAVVFTSLVPLLLRIGRRLQSGKRIVPEATDESA